MDRQNMLWFWRRYLRKHAGMLSLVLALILVQGLVYQQFLAMTESGLRVIFDSGALRELVIVCVTVFVLFTVRGIVSFLAPAITVKVSNQAVFEMRRDLIQHMMDLDLAYFERTRSGEILQRLVTQTQAIGVFVGLGVAGALRDAVTVVVVSGYLIWKNPILFGTAVIVLPFIIVVMNLVSDRVKKAQGEAEHALADYMNGIEETVHGMRTVKIASQEKVEQDRLNKGTSAIQRLMNRVQITQAFVLPTIDFSSAFVYVLVIGGGGYMVLSPNFDIDGAGIITFLLGMVMVFDPARLLAQFFGALQSNLVLLDRVRSFYHERPSIAEHPDALDHFDAKADITLEGVTFSYTPDKPLFQDLDMVFRGGEVSAIVGSTGSGKTTILALLSRLYDVQGGQIRFGTTPIDHVQIPVLRAAFAVVAQDIVIFNASIWDNIRYVRPDASEEDIWAAAEAAEIAPLMRERGDAPVGPKGAQLSGGQKQRIAIARAFLSDAPIVLLDEATSALDQATEERIRAAINRLTRNRTTIVVAHRLSSVADADRIFVLESGALVEQGRHADLLETNGLYARLYHAQKQGYDTPAGATATSGQNAVKDR
ncbi:MAG: ABC transporter ATP-binding protein [Pseudomonadota bacterium]